MVPYDAGDHFEQIFLLYVDAGGRSLLIGDRLENCWLATSNSCSNNSESIDKKFFHLSVSTRNGLTSDYKRVYKTEISYFILLTTTRIQPTVLVEYPRQTASSSLPQVDKAAEHTGN